MGDERTPEQEEERRTGQTVTDPPEAEKSAEVEEVPQPEVEEVPQPETPEETE